MVLIKIYENRSRFEFKVKFLGNDLVVNATQYSYKQKADEGKLNIN